MKPLRHKWKLTGSKDRTPTTKEWSWRCARCGKGTETARTRRLPWKPDLRPPPKPQPGDCGSSIVDDVHSR